MNNKSSAMGQSESLTGSSQNQGKAPWTTPALTKLSAVKATQNTNTGGPDANPDVIFSGTISSS